MLRTAPLNPTTGPEVLDHIRRTHDARFLTEQQRRSAAEFIALNSRKYHLTVQQLIQHGICADEEDAEELLYSIS